MSSILIGKAVYSILSGDTAVKGYVGSKIYPIFAPDETLNPFIVYTRNDVNTTYTKDGLLYDQAVVSVNVVSDNYSENINTAQAVRNALELVVGTYNGVMIHSCLLSNVSEDFGVDGFITTLDFTFIVR